MFTYHRTIRVQDTDATGVLYFANQLQIGMEAFEEFLASQGFSLNEMIEKKKFLLPVVHAEADFAAPLYLGDQLEVTLSFSHIGNRSFTHTSDILKGGKKVGTVTIIHAVLCPKTKRATPIPLELSKIFTCA
ncbi:acyl-CoA thioesterase [Candidatus Neptunochlamydia vexilliferae]|uniref:1,4-dihydroxy-2-naphthoyl-CoA hydrolase n=1 Tax=Candidatus Neptunichlamydia vexilliferae TaxID=1651774 RepID=A0ABS0AYH2_9BACT|nr:thioesterase family protein [Candidatus Neptunochlamydia vexilliferae]MBF5058642.1 1,4-dihydroxy-2-naphthoyl-CoA hydrolase [Candidatus Neptunochlamydia vexilliferae]